MPPITSFHGDYDFLSNFAYSPLTYEGETYPTVEHAFQAAKTFDPAEQQKVREASSPGSAKRLGRRVTLRADWETVKYDIMLALLRQKFSAPDFRPKLLATGDADLIEGNTWGDRTWGCVQVKGQWVGKNHLGKLLMQVRAELQAADKGSA
ncbi:MAG: NADAR family protein [Caldilinea sp. CFX5]|nr:NADAR family protein [Caldilinea sp. CFX5]